MQEGVGVFQTEGTQRQSVEVLTAVENIASDRASSMRQVQADLMSPSCDRQRQHQRPTLASAQHPEARLSRLAFRTMIDPVLAVLRRIGPQRLLAHPFAQSRNAVGHRQVGLFNSPLSEHPRQRRHGTLALGEQQHPGGRRIQTVHKA